MPFQEKREKSVRQKLNPINFEFKDKVVLLVDDSIVRGTTSRQIIEMARSAGAKKVYFASASPPIRYQNVYGIDMAATTELIAHNRTEDEISELIGADWLIYQDLEDLIRLSKYSTNSVQDYLSDKFTSLNCINDDFNYDPKSIDLVEEFANDLKQGSSQERAIVARHKGESDGKCLILFSHPDTEKYVHDDGWNHDPFEPKIINIIFSYFVVLVIIILIFLVLKTVKR